MALYCLLGLPAAVSLLVDKSRRHRHVSHRGPTIIRRSGGDGAFHNSINTILLREVKTSQMGEEADNIVTAHQFEVTLPQPSAGEAWSLRLSMPTKLPMEDYYVDLRGIPPLLAGSRDALLRPRA